jgi:hypothetical protein
VGNLADDGPYTPLGIVPHYMNRDNKDAAGQQSIYSHHLSDESNPVRSNVFFEFGSAQGSSIHDWNRLVGGCKQADNSGTSNKSGSTYWITAIGPAVAGHGGEFGDGIAPAIAR